MPKRNQTTKGFARCGLSLKGIDMDSGKTINEGGISWTKGGKAFVYCEFNQEAGTFTYINTVVFYINRIPIEYRKHEFEEFYRKGFKPHFVPDIEDELMAIIMNEFNQIVTGERTAGMQDAVETQENR